MFVLNWFMQTLTSDEPDKISDATNNVVIPKQEYETILARMQNLENLLTNLNNRTQQACESPIMSRGPSMPSTPIYISSSPPKLAYSPLSYISRTATNDNDMTPFQLELKKRIMTLREKMGESHGFGIDKMELNCVDDLDKLERSILDNDFI